MKEISWFVSICERNGLRLGDEQAAMFEKYLDLLLSWNSRVNLISRRDEQNFYSHHALNCISFLFSRKLQSDATILDLGTGGGLPGIPLKIIERDLTLTLVDSIVKKTTALSDVVAKMKLDRVRVVNGRAEVLSRTDEYQGKFHYVVTRAAGKLDEVIKWSRGFLKKVESFSGDQIPTGTLIVLKGGTIEDELRAARNLKFVESIGISDIVFNGMDEVENKNKKLVLVNYRQMKSSQEMSSTGRKS
jgi:16S rRNA (guanine527-N7)-methyltransferase